MAAPMMARPAIETPTTMPIVAPEVDLVLLAEVAVADALAV